MNKNITKTFKIIFIIFLATTPAGSKENQVGDEVQFCKKNMQSLLAIPFNYTPTELDYNKNFENVCYRLVKSNQPAWYDFRNCLNKAYEQKFESALYLLPQESKSIVQKVRNQTSFSGSQESKFEQYTHLLVQINRKHRVISDINFNLSEWLENCQNPEVAKLGSRKWCRDELMRELNVSQEKIETLTMPLAKVHFCEVDSFRKYQKILIYCAQNKIREKRYNAKESQRFVSDDKTQNSKEAEEKLIYQPSIKNVSVENSTNDQLLNAADSNIIKNLDECYRSYNLKYPHLRYKTLPNIPSSKDKTF